MQARTAWTKTPHGWRRGRHRIQLVAPGLWALLEERSHDDPDAAIPIIVTTSASLGTLKRAAERREWRRWKRRRTANHSAWLVAAMVGMGLSAALPPVWMVVGIIVLILLAFRSLAIVADTLTEGSWTRVSQTYQ